MDEKAKKQIPLRLSPALYSALAAWAADDFRSVNGQIEYLLTECVKRHRGGAPPEEIPPGEAPHGSVPKE